MEQSAPSRFNLIGGNQKSEIKNLKSKIKYLVYKKVRGYFGLLDELQNVKIGRLLTEEIDFENGIRRADCSIQDQTNSTDTIQLWKLVQN